MKDEKKYNLTLVPMWITKNGNYFSIEIGPEHYDAIQQVAVGGKLLFKMMPEEKRKNENSPNAYLEYVNAEEVAAFKTKTVDGKGKAPTRAPSPRPAFASDDI